MLKTFAVLATIGLLLLNSCSEPDLGPGPDVRLSAARAAGTAAPAIAFTQACGTGALCVMDADGGHKTAVFGTGKNVYSSSWAPDGSAIAFWYGVGGAVYAVWRVDISVVNGVPVGSNAHALVDTSTGTPAWSPLGDVIAVYGPSAGRAGQNCCLMTIPAQGGPASLIYTAAVGRSVGTPAWSPDGAELAFKEFGTGNGTYEIRVLTLATGAVRIVVPAPRLYYVRGFLDWSRDGSRIALGAMEKSNSKEQIWIVDVATGALGNTGLVGRSPAWSPDGSQLGFEAFDARGRSSIKALNLATGAVTTLSTNGQWPEWRR
jgi:Tol biopolymer transport system component